MDGETGIERSLKRFVLDKTGESVYLELRPDIVEIRHVSRHTGSLILSNFWMRVLQHPNNYPPYRYEYGRRYDVHGKWQVILDLEDVSIKVHTQTGSLIIHGDFAIDWFVNRFPGIMDAYDDHIMREPQPLEARYREYIPVQRRLNEQIAEIKARELDDNLAIITRMEERGLNSRGNGTSFPHKWLESPITEVLEEESTIWKSLHKLNEQLQDQQDDKWFGKTMGVDLDSLETGCMCDGPSYIYKLWHSLLKRWFSQKNTAVYIVTRNIDACRLQDVCRLLVRYHLDACLEALVVCSKNDAIAKLAEAKKTTLKKHFVKDQLFIEARVYNKIFFNTSDCHANFVASVYNGFAEVLVTSATFNSSCFDEPSLHTVSFFRMTEDKFKANYLTQLPI